MSSTATGGTGLPREDELDFVFWVRGGIFAFNLDCNVVWVPHHVAGDFHHGDLAVWLTS